MAVDVSASENALRVFLSDGREISVPLNWFPRLVAGTPRQRRRWELIGRGVGIHWEDLDEDISVESLLTPEKMVWFREPDPSTNRFLSKATKARLSRVLQDQAKSGKQRRFAPLVKSVGFTEAALKVALADGRKICLPLDSLPGLRDASPRQLRDWGLIARGVGIYWKELDEDVLVEDLLTPGMSHAKRTRNAARVRDSSTRPTHSTSVRR
jgi:hypothetical protein